MSSRMRKTSSQTGNRRSHHGAKKSRLSKDNGVYHMRHRASLETGKYRDREVIDVNAKQRKQVERMREKAKSRGDDPNEITTANVKSNKALSTNNE